jgi:thiosulfate reductase cytochrome b subunit
MSPGQQRKVQRAVHLTTGLVLVLYVYAPLQTQLERAIQLIVLPLLVATGVVMWQAARIRRLRRQLRT